jgi:hypothetical protein
MHGKPIGRSNGKPMLTRTEKGICSSWRRNAGGANIMSDNKAHDEKERVRIAPQPDGLFHLVTGRDWLRSFCGIRLARYESRYVLLYHYGSEPSHCRECAAVLDQRAKFPESANEELKPILEGSPNYSP